MADVAKVRAFFADPRTYLAGSHVPRARLELVRSLVGSQRGARILDLGCGDGSVSLAFVEEAREITLVDASPGMLGVARAAIPEAHRAKVRCVETAVERFEPEGSYDLVLCLGLLAHVPSVKGVIDLLGRVLAPDGRAAVQFTDWDRLLGRWQGWWYSRRGKGAYALNPTRLRDILALVENNGLTPVAARRQGLLLPGMGLLPLSQRLSWERRVLTGRLTSAFAPGTALLLRHRASAPTLTERPRVAFVGAMTGAIPGQVPTQAETLANLLGGEGYRVLTVSSSPRRWRRLADILQTLFSRRREIDVVCLQVFSGPSFAVQAAAGWLGRLLGHRIVMVIRGGAMPELIARWPRWTRRVLRLAHCVVVPSSYLRRALAPLDLPLQVVPNVIDVSSYTFKLRERVAPRLLWMRAFHEIYDPATAVRALAQIRKTHPAASLTMGGPDLGLQRATEALTRELGLEPAVRFAGFLDAEGKRREAAGHDIYLNTNRIDNMPVSVLEMAAMGLPVVSTHVGGIPDLLQDGRTGLLVPPNDSLAVATAVSRLVADPDLARGLSEQGRALAETCTWESVRPRWVRLLAEVAGVSGLPAFGGRDSA